MVIIAEMLSLRQVLLSYIHRTKLTYKTAQAAVKQQQHQQQLQHLVYNSVT